MAVKTLIAAASLSLGAGFVVSFPAGVMMSEAGVSADGKGTVILYSFEKEYTGAENFTPGTGFRRNFGAFKREDCRGTVSI